jgi:hypothetical protein
MRRKTQSSSGYAFVADPPLRPAPAPTLEPNTVRVADLIEIVARALADHPEARLALAHALETEIAGGPDAQVQP